MARTRRSRSWMLAATVALLAGVGVAPGSAQVKVGEVFPDMLFDSLLAPGDYRNLGIQKDGGSFRLSEVAGQLLVIEFFNQYCFTCQRQAPLLESFFRDVSSGDLAGRVRVLAVGVGNRANKLASFRNEFHLTYPIAPDPLFERFMEAGDPGGTPFTVFLSRKGDRWTLVDSHMGLQGDTELLARSKVLLEGRIDSSAPPVAEERRRDRPPLEFPRDERERRAQSLLSRVAGAAVQVAAVDLRDGAEVYQALGPGRKPTGLFARVASRKPVCDLCHPIHFVFAFDSEGHVRGFEPIHVTKYGNEVWNVDDDARMEKRLTGREMATLRFDPDVDAVTTGTMSSALIFDEVRRAAALLEGLRGGK